MAKSRKVSTKVQIVHVNTPDSEIRIASAIDMLLAAAIPNEDCTFCGDENENRENGSTASGDEESCTGEDQ